MDRHTLGRDQETGEERVNLIIDATYQSSLLIVITRANYFPFSKVYWWNVICEEEARRQKMRCLKSIIDRG